MEKNGEERTVGLHTILEVDPPDGTSAIIES
jgi:hypothetical protein